MALGAVQVLDSLSPTAESAAELYYMLQFIVTARVPEVGPLLRRWYIDGVLKRITFDSQPLDVVLLGALSEYGLDPRISHRVLVDALQAKSFAFVLSAHRALATTDVALSNTLIPALLQLAETTAEKTRLIRHLAVFSRKYTWESLLAFQLQTGLKGQQLTARFNEVLSSVASLLRDNANGDSAHPLVTAIVSAFRAELTADSLLGSARAGLRCPLVEDALRHVVRIERNASRHIDLRTESGFAGALRSAPQGLRVLIVNGRSAEYDADDEARLDAVLQRAILPEVSPGLFGWLEESEPDSTELPDSTDTTYAVQ